MKNKKNKPLRKNKTSKNVISDYDSFDVSNMIDKKKALLFEDIKINLPETPPTQVVSIRLPSSLLNELKALGSERDIAYHSLVKMMLAEGVAELKGKKKVAA